MRSRGLPRRRLLKTTGAACQPKADAKLEGMPLRKAWLPLDDAAYKRLTSGCRIGRRFPTSIFVYRPTRLRLFPGSPSLGDKLGGPGATHADLRHPLVMQGGWRFISVVKNEHKGLPHLRSRDDSSRARSSIDTRWALAAGMVIACNACW